MLLWWGLFVLVVRGSFGTWVWRGCERWRQEMRRDQQHRPRPTGSSSVFYLGPPSFVPLRPAAAKKGAGLRHAANDADKRQWGGRIARGLHQRGTPFPTPARQLPFRSGAGKRRLRDLPDSESGRQTTAFFCFCLCLFFSSGMAVCDFLFLARSAAKRRGRVAKARERDAILAGFHGDALLPSGWAELEEPWNLLDAGKGFPDRTVGSRHPDFIPPTATALKVSITDVEHRNKSQNCGHSKIKHHSEPAPQSFCQYRRRGL